MAKKVKKQMETNQITQTNQTQIPGTTSSGEADFQKIKEIEKDYFKLSELTPGQHVMTFVGQSVKHRKWTNNETGETGEVDELILTTEAPLLFSGQKTVAITWILEAGKKSLLYQLKEIVLQRPSQNLIGVQIALKVEKGKNGKNQYTVFWLNQGK
jgi:hypothetical protein